MEALLIGGTNHRRRVTQIGDSGVIRVAVERHPLIDFSGKPDFSEISFEEYYHYPIDMEGGYHPIRGIFFLKGMNPMLFLRNILLDYFK